jgi:hypothetical protein
LQPKEVYYEMIRMCGEASTIVRDVAAVSLVGYLTLSVSGLYSLYSLYSLEYAVSLMSDDLERVCKEAAMA